MAYTQADLDAIRAAKKTGAMRVELPSVGTVTYRSLAEMERIELAIQAEVNAGSGVKPMRRVKIVMSKGL